MDALRLCILLKNGVAGARARHICAERGSLASPNFVSFADNPTRRQMLGHATAPYGEDKFGADSRGASSFADSTVHHSVVVSVRRNFGMSDFGPLIVEGLKESMRASVKSTSRCIFGGRWLGAILR